MTMPRKNLKEPAGIEYAGLPGMSEECQEAVLRLIQFGDSITSARLLTCDRDHAFILTVNTGDLVAIKSGFSSGYRGAGPRALSYTLTVLKEHGAEVDEYRVDAKLLERLDQSALLRSDLEQLEELSPVRPSRFSDYVFEDDWDRHERGDLWVDFPYVIPFAIIDQRLADLAIKFTASPDQCLLDGYRRLEDIIRKRTSLKEHGQKLFSQAFHGAGSALTWKGVDEGEHAGRANLFTGAYGAHRNPRAHREPRSDLALEVSEFLLLNHLFRLESQTEDRPPTETSERAV